MGECSRRRSRRGRALYKSYSLVSSHSNILSPADKLQEEEGAGEGAEEENIERAGRDVDKLRRRLEIAYMDRPCMGGVQLVDWCFHQPTRRALKNRSCSRLRPWKVHAWEVFN